MPPPLEYLPCSFAAAACSGNVDMVICHVLESSQFQKQVHSGQLQALLQSLPVCGYRDMYMYMGPYPAYALLRRHYTNVLYRPIVRWELKNSWMASVFHSLIGPELLGLLSRSSSSNQA